MTKQLYGRVVCAFNVLMLSLSQLVDLLLDTWSFTNVSAPTNLAFFFSFFFCVGGELFVFVFVF